MLLLLQGQRSPFQILPPFRCHWCHVVLVDLNFAGRVVKGVLMVVVIGFTPAVEKGSEERKVLRGVPEHPRVRTGKRRALIVQSWYHTCFCPAPAPLADRQLGWSTTTATTSSSRQQYCSLYEDHPSCTAFASMRPYLDRSTVCALCSGALGTDSQLSRSVLLRYHFSKMHMAISTRI